MFTRRVHAAITSATLCVALLISSTTARADDDASRGSSAKECLPGINKAFKHNSAYRELFSTLARNTEKLKSLLDAVSDQATYEALLAQAETVASTVSDGRVVVTLPDGTVVLDTAATDDPTNQSPAGNSYEHFQSKTVNENHNSRVAIFAAQLYPCGLGLERKLSTSTGDAESYVALRLGKHLDNSGTARLSTIQ